MAMQCFSVLQSGVCSRTFKDYQGACKPLQPRSPLIRTMRRPRKMSILSGLNLNKMQGLSLDPQGQSKLSVLNNEASVLSGCLYSAV